MAKKDVPWIFLLFIYPTKFRPELLGIYVVRDNDRYRPVTVLSHFCLSDGSEAPTVPNIHKAMATYKEHSRDSTTLNLAIYGSTSTSYGVH